MITGQIPDNERGEYKKHTVHHGADVSSCTRWATLGLSLTWTCLCEDRKTILSFIQQNIGITFRLFVPESNLGF